MTTYQLQINESTSLGKSIIALLQSVPQAVKLQKTESDTNELLLSRFEKGLKEAKMMKDGILPKKPLSELYENC